MFKKRDLSKERIKEYLSFNVAHIDKFMSGRSKEIADDIIGGARIIDIAKKYKLTAEYVRIVLISIVAEIAIDNLLSKKSWLEDIELRRRADAFNRIKYLINELEKWKWIN